MSKCCLSLSTYRYTLPLGRGMFSTVNRGIWQDDSGMIYEVAVKSLAPGSPTTEKVKLLQEAIMIHQFSHPNVIQLYGIIMTDEQVSNKNRIIVIDFKLHHKNMHVVNTLLL